MSCRLRWPCCVLAVMVACLSPVALAAPARGMDIWSDCYRLPVVYRQVAPAPSAPAKPQPVRVKFAQATLAPPSVTPTSVVEEKKPDKKPESKPMVAESAKPESPGTPHGPAVREEGPFYDTYSIALKDAQKPANDQCSVTFTNLSDRPVKLMIENQERSLGKGETVTLPVKRQFVWRMEGREPQNELVGTGDFALQIVIRR